jgi:AraC-like DNA-binding protein
MIRVETLYDDSRVSLTIYDHPPGLPHDDPAEEVATRHSVCFVERGGFDLQHRRRRWRLAPGALFVTRPGMVYRCSHNETGADDVCLSIAVSPDVVDDLQAATGRRWSALVPVAPLTNRLAYLRRRLGDAAGSGDGAMSVPALVGEVMAALQGPEALPGRLFRERQLGWYARRVEAARDLLDRDSAGTHTLATLARSAGMSPFHFSRVFRELVGVPPHRYLVRVRLRRAAERLRAGAGVTETCFAAGFNNLSHFIRVFHRTYGVPPSRYPA